MKFVTEKDSIDYFVKRLEDKGWNDITPTQALNQFSYYDIDATTPDLSKKVRFELKRRDYDSTRFGDSICEKDKYDKFVYAIKNGEINNGFLVSFFNDIFTIDNIEKPKEIDYIYANHQTEFADRDIRKKNIVHYEQKRKYNY